MTSEGDRNTPDSSMPRRISPTPRPDHESTRRRPHRNQPRPHSLPSHDRYSMVSKHPHPLLHRSLCTNNDQCTSNCPSKIHFRGGFTHLETLTIQTKGGLKRWKPSTKAAREARLSDVAISVRATEMTERQMLSHKSRRRDAIQPNYKRGIRYPGKVHLRERREDAAIDATRTRCRNAWWQEVFGGTCAQNNHCNSHDSCTHGYLLLDNCQSIIYLILPKNHQFLSRQVESLRDHGYHCEGNLRSTSSK